MSGNARHNQDAHTRDQRFIYEGFSAPNGTLVPDDVFDVLAPRLSEAELRVLLYIVRRTFGFGKRADAISLKQLTDGITARDGRVLDSGTGMSRKGVIGGVKGLLTKGIITVQKHLDERGENEINIYSLRFRDGLHTLGPTVVTQGNHRSNPATLPAVTKGYPQESVLQDTVLQQPSTQQRPPSPSNFTPATQNVVVNKENHPQPHDQSRLYESLKELGVHHHKASKLLREHDHDTIELMCDFVTYRLQNGWAPQESVAAWLVAAIKNRYQLPSYFQSKAERKKAEAVQQQQLALEQEMDRQAKEQVEEGLRRQRAARLDAMGLEQNMDKLWQQAQRRLRDQSAWSVSMSMCFLKNIENGVAVLLAPASVQRRLMPQLAEIEAALASVCGNSVQVVVADL